MEKEYTGHYKDVYVRDPQGNAMAVYRIRKNSLYLYEIPMYGSNRLGVIKEKMYLVKKHTQNSTSITSLPVLPIPQLTAFTGKQTIYTLGKKHYESTDWLGNVRVTYTDKKSWQQNKFALNVSSSLDYYPFGSVMEGRGLEITNYRFGFQGQEGDDEVFGKDNLWAYKYRLHDARLGRFFSVDPLAGKYPYNSVYAFSENRVIDGVELEGLEKSKPKTNEGKTALQIYEEKFGKINIYNPVIKYSPMGKGNKSGATGWVFEQYFHSSNSQLQLGAYGNTYSPPITRFDNRTNGRIDIIIGDKVRLGTIKMSYIPNKDENGKNLYATYQIGKVDNEGNEIILEEINTNQPGSISVSFYLNEGENLFIRSKGGNTQTSVEAPVQPNNSESDENE
ncbi:MAG: hypothetical protein KatS3mg027_2654 [Bacteroidia bacterium]|nr:MAG: hypothetical protein KatS3mg027_2654 [Bacteroidia bacterium]